MRLALALKEHDRIGVVINADASQVYSDLRVLSARPSEDEMQGVEHRLFGSWDGARPCSTVDWAETAKREIADVHASGKVPILVGGTGMYIRTLLDGIAPIPEIDTDIRARVRSLPTPDAYAALQIEDPERAAALNESDSQRIARALEVVRSTGKPLSHWQARLEGGIGEKVDINPAIILPERDQLYARCDKRFETMLNLGAVEEVEALLDRKIDPDFPVMRAIGVAEIAGWLRGDWSREEAIVRGQQATRNYAKRQFTWFRRQPPEDWSRFESHDYDLQRYFERLLLN